MSDSLSIDHNNLDNITVNSSGLDNSVLDYHLASNISDQINENIEIPATLSSENINSNVQVPICEDSSLKRTRSGRNVRPRKILDL